MLDLFESRDPVSASYLGAYDAFAELREIFHRSGRLDDSNSKLDEVAKLFATYLAFKNGQIERFPPTDSDDLVVELQAAFEAASRLPQYQLANGSTIFGPEPRLAILDGDEVMAAGMAKLVRLGVDAAFQLRREGRPFDILNEAFGHFVRDNFRSNIEDAQYMTPPEVTEYMAEMLVQDLLHDGLREHDVHEPFTVLDPACGVGSFLAAFYHRAKDADLLNARRIRLLGQDKVERMVRLSTINLELFDVSEQRVTMGNSLEIGSPIDSLSERVDAILTNPPFGARFSQSHVTANCGRNTPFFSSRYRSANNITSELLFLDRSLQLLRKGGRLVIIVPNGVVSAKGLSALIRHYLAGVATLRAVIELPSTTFAQAGTRTKTVIVYLQKGAVQDSRPVFLGISRSLGFRVSARKGVQIKLAHGENDLVRVASSYLEYRRRGDAKGVEVLSSEPSCVIAPVGAVLDQGSWSPNRFSATMVARIDRANQCEDFELTPLRDVVEFCARQRKPQAWREGCAYISVLHVVGEGFLNIAAAFSYSPKTPGIPIRPGELLISRINPRIPRVCVVPDVSAEVLCSSEFEVMRMKRGADVYLLSYLMQTRFVVDQIVSLTSGTSASHSRIRTRDLGSVLVPMPRRERCEGATILALVEDYRSASQELSRNSLLLADVREREKDVLGALYR